MQIELGITKPKAETRVVVAMSGGVDSSVVAAMLHEAGYQVIGITLQLYDHGAAIGKKGACCAGQDIHDARLVADQLGIPHYVLNYENRFRDSVMDDFVDTYLSGETPIPCVKCNQSVKFKDLLATAKELEADALATGHYVQRLMQGNKSELHAGLDNGKDQSYFLFATTQAQLDYLRFPLGGMTKEHTRQLALRYGLAVSDKPDSQDICFVPNGNYAGIIEKLRPGACGAGDIIHTDGTVLGRHEGIIHYTVGQRKGLGVAYAHPLYVIRLDPDKKQVIVGEKSALAKKRFMLRDVNWLEDQIVYAPRSIEIKWRSAQTLKSATVTALEDHKALVETDDAEYAISAGQACVMYNGTRVVGGGWITREQV